MAPNTQAITTAKTTRRLLVADDDAFYREIAVTSLTAAGYDVKAAADGVEALEIINTMPLDIAVVDVGMPRMGGLELIAMVRTAEASRHLPIIVITGNDDTESVEKAFQAGATSFVAKPLNWPLFVQHVNFVHKAAQAENEMRDAIRTAEFLSDLKSRVLSVLVGEFQSPLRTALGMAELLRKEVYGPLGQRIYLEYAEDLHRSLSQLNSTQLKMMNAGRVLSGELLLKEEDVALAECVRESVEAIRPKAERRGIDIEARIVVPATVRLKCDRSLVNQALKMLIEGAIEFAPRNSSITVDARLDGDGGFAFTVEDNAPALPDNMVREILNVAPAGRPDAQASSVSRNTGLIISRVLAEAHQGKLALNSTMGEGTISRLVFPKNRIQAALAMPTQPAAAVTAQGGVAEPPMFRSSAAPTLART